MSSVSAIIPTWNRADLLESILRNLNAQTRPPDQIIVVDNGSSDGTRQVAQRFESELIEFPENRGFAAAVNEGVSRSVCDWILIVNNDVTLDPDWLSVLVGAAEQHQAAFAAGKLFQTAQAGHIDGTWDLVSRGAHAWRCGYGRPDGATWCVRRKISFAPMTAALFHRRVFELVGLLDTRFEAYYEDVDFGVRCALAGLEGVYEPAAIATHGSKSTLGKASARVLYLTARNQVFLLAKHYPAETLRRFAWPIFVGQLLSVIGAAQQGQLFPALRGKWAGIKGWSAFRNTASDAAAGTFCRSEKEIHRLQREIGFDPYWRLYFSLVRPA